MSVLHLYFRTAWNDYFSPTSTTNLNSETFNSRQNHSNSGVHVSNCLFRSISSSSNGGALYCASTYFLVESSSFISCNTCSNGGAIYFSNSDGGQSVLHEVCGYDCCTTHPSYPSYQFAYICVKNDISSKNYINYSSISRCVSENLKSLCTLYLCYGKTFSPSVNMSLNKCHEQSFYFHPSIDSSSVTCSFTYSSFSDNNLTGYSLFYLRMGGAKYEIKSCNILRNTQVSLSTEGTISTWGTTNITDSCILENKAKYIFYQGDSSYTTTLSNCTVDSTSNNGHLTIRNTVTKSFILGLNHISTLNCHSEYDSAGTLIPIIQTPSSSTKQIRLCLCDNFIYHTQNRWKQMLFI
jgi:hypothetical protein